MKGLSPRAYSILVIVISAFLVVTGALYVGLLVWLSVNNVEGGVALNKLELFCVGNLGLLLGCIFKPVTHKPE